MKQVHPIEKMDCIYVVWDRGHSYYCQKLKKWISSNTCLKCEEGVMK